MVKSWGPCAVRVDEAEPDLLCNFAWRGRCEAEVILRAKMGLTAAVESESDVEIEVRRVE